MARANRHHIPGQVWHITHRCHKKEFLLKFARDRKRWLQWLFEAKKRFELDILNYTVTSNHIHLLVVDGEEEVIPKSLQLVAGKTAQEFNRRKERKGAFWEDRYHATAIEIGDHFLRCLVYIDLNMVRNGVVQHPSEEAIIRDGCTRQRQWSEGIAVGSERFVRDVLEKLQVRAKGRKVREGDDRYELREREAAYNAHFPCENGLLRIENGFYWNE